MPEENILIETSDFVQTITINRPEKLNALNRATISALSSAFDAAHSNDGVRVIILTGSGSKAFVAGADISEFAGFTKEEGQKLSAEGHRKLFDKVEQTTKPVIAAVNGFALGGGLELALACHMRIFSDTARVGLPEVTLGVIPGYGGTQRLPQIIGKGRAIEAIVTGGMITAVEAHRMGLANHVTPAEELLSFSKDLASKIARNSPTAITYAIKATLAGYAFGVDGYASEIDCFGKCFGTGDFKEGTTAFLEKRKHNFKGN